MPPVSLFPFTDYFKGFEKVDAVRAVFHDRTESVLQKLKVGFISNRRMYMGIRDKDGNIAVGAYHLENSDKRTLYLDIVHELFHVKQFADDRKSFRKEHQKFMGNRSLYYSSPIEVPAYYHTVKEAKRIGMSYEEIVEYLKMGPFPPKVFAKFLKAMDLDRKQKARENSLKLPVQISRTPSIGLYPFGTFFKGFEDLPQAKALYGKRTKKIVDNLLVEFVDYPFRSIFPSDYGKGHIVVSLDYFKRGDLGSIYLDALLSLSLMKSQLSGKPQSPDQDFANNPDILESYRSMIREAKSLGFSDSKIAQHLELPRFLMGSADYARFSQALGVSSPGYRRPIN